MSAVPYEYSSSLFLVSPFSYPEHFAWKVKEIIPAVEFLGSIGGENNQIKLYFASALSQSENDLLDAFVPVYTYTPSSPPPPNSDITSFGTVDTSNYIGTKFLPNNQNVDSHNINVSDTLGVDTRSVVTSIEGTTGGQAMIFSSDSADVGKTIFGISKTSNTGVSWEPCFVVTQSQRVGIGGVSAPTESLDVNGNVSVSGTINGRNLTTDSLNIDSFSINNSYKYKEWVNPSSTDTQNGSNNTLGGTQNPWWVIGKLPIGKYRFTITILHQNFDDEKDSLDFDYSFSNVIGTGMANKISVSDGVGKKSKDNIYPHSFVNMFEVTNSNLDIELSVIYGPSKSSGMRCVSFRVDFFRVI